MFKAVQFDFGPDSKAIPNLEETVETSENSFQIKIFNGWHAFSSDDGAQPQPMPFGNETWGTFVDKNNTTWWYLYSLDEYGRKVSELFRTAGQCTIDWTNNRSLNIQVNCEDLDDLLDSFKYELAYLIIDEDSYLNGKLRTWGNDSNLQLLSEKDLANLAKMAEALEKLLPRLKTQLISKQSMTSPVRAKPSSSLIRQRLLRPTAKLVLAYASKESYDTGENRFLLQCSLKALHIIKTAELCRRQYSSVAKRTNWFSQLEKLDLKLSKISEYLLGKGIKKYQRKIYFNKVIFQQNLLYSDFYRKQKHFFENIEYLKDDRIVGVLKKEYRELERITHLSEIYEKWCLINIIYVLIGHFKFKPQSEWQNTLLRCVSNKEYDISLIFQHPDFRYRLKLTYQKQIDVNKKTIRPDFVLEFLDVQPKPSKPIRKLVLDAKFRTFIGKQGCENLLDQLYKKGYGGNINGLHLKNEALPGDMVFLLHSSRKTRTSQYYINRKNDVIYGGWIYDFPDSDDNKKFINLTKIILEWFQITEYEQDWSDMDQKICFNCGASGKNLLQISSNGANKKIKCNCSNYSIRTVTHCRHCYFEPIFKNMIYSYLDCKNKDWNDIRCPRCGKAYTD
jgi:hypothetical protein